MRRTAPFLTVLLVSASLTACAITPANPNPDVPPLPPETVALPPVTDQPIIWQPAHWDWTGNGYVLQPGMYVPLTGHSNQWLPAHWALVGGTWVWQPAHWL